MMNSGRIDRDCPMGRKIVRKLEASMTRRSVFMPLTVVAMLIAVLATPIHAAEKPIKTFILAGQSNMVGWGDSTKLPGDLRKGNDRVLMFENGKWQPIRPFKPATKGQKRVGLTEFSFGPEIAFGHEMAKAWPDETIGIIKFSIGGTSILAWKPDWSKEDADRVGQGRLGSLYEKLMEKVDKASKTRDIEIVGFLWLQGGGDTKNADVAKEYLDNLKSVVAAVRKNTGVTDLSFIYGSSRREGIPDDPTDFEPPRLPPGRPGAFLVLKAQFDAQKEISHSKMVILRDIEKHPKNVHYNTTGQLAVGKLFAKAVLSQTGQPSQVNRICGKTPLQILTMLGAKGEAVAQPAKLEEYYRIFGFIDANDDGNLSTKEFVEDGTYLTRQARQGIFRASDANGNGVVSEQEYVINRIITDEAKAIMAKIDEDGDGRVAQREFLGHSGLSEDLSKAVFNEFDTDGNGELLIPEYLRIWGRWARSGNTGR
jgi:Ca2+-binding EF-hand superfamily protein